MTLPQRLMCDDTGFKDHATSAMEPCDHLQLPPLPDLLPCPNPACGSTNVQFRSNARGAQWVSCGNCSLSVSDGDQARQYATWNGLFRAAGTPTAWLSVNRHGDKELIFTWGSDYAHHLRELGHIQTPLYAASPINGESENG